MGIFYPLAGVASLAFTLALTYKTGKNAKRKFERKQARHKLR